MNKPLLALSLLASLLPIAPLVAATHGGPPCPTYDTHQAVGLVTIHANAAGQFQLDVDGGWFYIVYDDTDVYGQEYMTYLVERLVAGYPPSRYELTRIIDEVGYEISAWVYQEANGIEGLQRHDFYCTTPGYNSEWQADWIIW